MKTVITTLALLAAYMLAAPALALPESVAGLRNAKMRGNAIWLDGKPGEILYRTSGDLDGDGVREAVLCVAGQWWSGGILVLRRHGFAYRLVDSVHTGTCDMRADVTDINGDRELEIVMRAISGDGHWYCEIYRLIKNHLVNIASFRDTRFRDLDHDGVPEALSVEPVSFMYLGDHWLTIWKWNGQGYTDVSRRFPRQYDAVIRDLKRTIYRMHYTRYFGSSDTPRSDPEAFADMYYYLGRAYEFRGFPDKAKVQYAIAYRLQPDEPRTAEAFKRAWRIPKP